MLGEQHLVADLDIKRARFSIFQYSSCTDRDDFTLVGLFRRRIRNHDTGCRFVCAFLSLHQYAIMQGRSRITFITMA